MKITKRQLRRIIREEKEKIAKENLLKEFFGMGKKKEPKEGAPAADAKEWGNAFSKAIAEVGKEKNFGRVAGKKIEADILKKALEAFKKELGI